VAGFYGEAQIRRTTDGSLVRALAGHSGWVNDAQFFSDASRIVTAGNDHNVVVWNPTNGAALHVMTDHANQVYDLDLSRDDGRIVSGSADGTVRLWNATTGQYIRTLTDGTITVNSVAFSEDGQRVLVGLIGRTEIWNPFDGTLLSTFSHGSGEVVSVGFLPGAQTALAACGSSAFIWNVTDETLLRTYDHSRHIWDWHSEVSVAAVFPDGSRVITGCGDGITRLWPATGATTRTEPSAPVSTGDKFILISGGGDYAGNPIPGQTKVLADRAFFTCLVRGYRLDEILFLSAFDDWASCDSNNDGLADADAYAGTADFWSAIDSWAADTARLVVYMIDHGSYNVQTGEYYFHLNPDEVIKASELDAHLDALQSRTGTEVILIVDCCFSGGFVAQCTAPPDARRIVISSTTENALAVFPSPVGAESFSYHFLSFAILGNTLKDCFNWTRLAFRAMGNMAGQEPWLDDNSDGVSGKTDGALAARHVLGRYPAFGLTAPRILDVAATETVAVGETCTLWAQLGEAVAAREVWALVVPEQQVYDWGEPVTQLERVDLAPCGVPNRWEATWTPTSEFHGLCRVTYFAVSDDPLNTNLMAMPISSGLTVLGTPVRLPWQLLP
jgi:hypothetical protein